MSLPHPFSKAVPVLHRMKAAGFEAYFVGGSVRDYLLKRDIHDVDIATSALPIETKEIFENTIDIGIDHGTILVKFQGEAYEITTFRSEAEYNDFRRPDQVQFIRSLREDLQRRDFTMNSIAMNENGDLIDPFHGQKALMKRQVQTVGNAEDRFQEDALRMMRAVRFVSQLCFELAPSTKMALQEHASLLKHIAVERIYAEMCKLINGKNKVHALEIMVDTGLFRYLPGMEDKKKTLIKLIDYLPYIHGEMQFWLLFLSLCPSMNSKMFLTSWRMPNKKINFLLKAQSSLAERHQKDWNNYTIYRAGIETMLEVEMVYAALHKIPNQVHELTRRYENLPIKDRQELSVNGSDLLTWSGRAGGPWVKELLADIEKNVVEEKIVNEQLAIRKWIQQCNRL
ncbi:CCA tRNA nucleotidyltransferase [Bacillus spongiae]|uniref:CCA-adding enzyme n=1 Tax=Bacillus spongiae TaxID=2683610 RepID=A0ABU8HDA7_9BACI